jgi:hypothetical protein
MCCNLEWLTELGRGQARIAISGSQIEELPDETDLTENIIPAHPSNLPLSDHVHRLIPLDRSPCRLEFPKSLLGVHSAFDRSMILFQDIVKVLHRSVPTTAAQGPFLLYVCDGCTVDRRQIRVDDARLRMGSITQRVAKQPFGCIGVAQRRK